MPIYCPMGRDAHSNILNKWITVPPIIDIIPYRGVITSIKLAHKAFYFRKKCQN